MEPSRQPIQQNGRLEISNNARTKPRIGFTIVEVLASAVLLGIGITASMGALASMSTLETRMRESEKMNRLAQQKLDEVLAMGDVNNAATDGNFEESGQGGYDWALEVLPSGVDSLDTIRVIVTKSAGGTKAPEAKAVGLMYTVPTATTGGAQ